MRVYRIAAGAGVMGGTVAAVAAGIALAGTAHSNRRIAPGHIGVAPTRSIARTVDPAIRIDLSLFRTSPAVMSSERHAAAIAAPVLPSTVTAFAQNGTQTGMNPALARSADTNGQEVSVVPAGSGACVVGPGDFACGSAAAFTGPNAAGLIVAGENESTPANEIQVDGVVQDGITSVLVSTAAGSESLAVVDNVYAGYVAGSSMTRAVATTSTGTQLAVFPQDGQ
jgi:hypothetical protein